MQQGLLDWLAYHLIALGPAVLFAVCLLETAVFAGLILPVGALIATAALFAARGYLDPGDVVFLALSGALVGDQVGFIMGRWFVPGVRGSAGTVSRLWRGALTRTEVLVERHRLLGVSVARTIPFVRTMMPWFAGRSGMPWSHFFAMDVLGVLLWGAVYLGGGYLAGYGWEMAAVEFGEVIGAILLAALLVGVLIFVRRTWAALLLRRLAGSRPGHRGARTMRKD
jgi:membrane-associated protein